ncbi:MAG: hypothetical protein NTU44_17980, partial [Bacteroidetes bacterium]|nr:hypothetical protein [Bacteroidota bacterium]
MYLKEKTSQFFFSRQYGYLVVVVYAIITFTGILYHEPWRDEAQAWLLGRDLSFTGLIREMGYDGSPMLWHLCLSILAKSGLPYFSMAFFNWALAVAAIVVFMRNSPFNPLTKTLFVFSYYLVYEYSVVARSYMLSVLLLFCLASIFRDRLKKPLLFGLLVALLVNTNTHNFLAAVAFGLIFLFDSWKKKKMNLSLKDWIALGIMLAGGIFALFTVSPPLDSWKPGLMNEFTWLASIDAISQAFIPTCTDN